MLPRQCQCVPDELDPALARLLQSEDEGPDLIGITFETLHESLGNQGTHSVHCPLHIHSTLDMSLPTFLQKLYSSPKLFVQLLRSFSTPASSVETARQTPLVQ